MLGYMHLWAAASEAMTVIEEPRTSKKLRLGETSMDLLDVSPEELDLLKQFYMKVGERAERRVTALRSKEQ